jgi:predicted N-acetyltransferase YhbS
VAKYIIREANQDDISGIARLRHTIKEFRPIETEEFISFWNSLIKSNPCLIQQVLVAVNEQGEMVAHYAMVPFRFLKDGELLLGGFLCQLMVHEDYRQELIFPRMELKFLRDYKDRGFNFAFSLGNREKVVKAHLSFGFCKIGDLPVYAKPYKHTVIARRRIKSNILNAVMMPGLFIAEKLIQLKRTSGNGDLAATEIPKFDSSIDQFLTDVRRHFPYSALRNSTILNWRFAGSPAVKYRILVTREEGNIIGYAVLRRMEMNRFDVLAIVDILFSPDRIDAGNSLLNAVHKIAVQLNVEMSACLLNSYDPLCPVLKKCGYFKTPETFSLFVHEPKGATPHFREDTFDKWHLTWFDNDAV